MIQGDLSKGIRGISFPLWGQQYDSNIRDFEIKFYDFTGQFFRADFQNVYTYYAI